jgi:hypothetical protein
MQAMGEATGQPPKSIATTVGRLRARGIIAPLSESGGNRYKPQLTPWAKAEWEKIKLREESKIVFTAEVFANTKEEALAEVWDIVVQLEAWDPKQGPFVFTPARMRNLT